MSRERRRKAGLDNVDSVKGRNRRTCKKLANVAVLERAPHINEELMVVFVKEGRCQHFYGMNKTGSCITVVVDWLWWVRGLQWFTLPKWRTSGVYICQFVQSLHTKGTQHSRTIIIKVFLSRLQRVGARVESFGDSQVDVTRLCGGVRRWDVELVDDGDK